MAQPRRAVIEELGDTFDDDFDLPLPPRPIPRQGLASSGSALPSIGGTPATSRVNPTDPGVKEVNDTTPYKTWTCVYPIYIDAKQPYGTGRRRVAREKSCWWPHSQLIADAARSLRLPVFHEPTKCHPRDWANPGRVKVLFKDDGRFSNAQITTKKQLLEAISVRIQQQQRSQMPLSESIKPSSQTPVLSNSVSGSKPSKGSKNAPAPPPRKSRPKAPKPPEPLPPIEDRYGGYSPLIESGVLVNTVKVALKQRKDDEKKAVEPSPGGGPSGKGKRKVIRVRA
ncbi:signal recognition particle, SRP19 subunit [Cantharellus anzutake]|uniref:signal recognition particle, SRP19 subunit n=1 Tax=Cantharellus anzutake TaxID=1750568 RepID=UPI001902C600|nr:signal recognition particle, SRP19 subunit [Cantharellus anzutake]KAF8329560.1 signal recognition particle, SRP19 subunit [Cantharellus anzutake]